jgi:hypothetical protein
VPSSAWMDVICCAAQNTIKRKGGFYSTASFSMTFGFDDDTVLIAHHYPYTYTVGRAMVLRWDLKR